MLLKSKEMYERLTCGGFTDEQAGSLVAVIEELAEVFVTKDFLRAELLRFAGCILTGVALLLALFEFVPSV